MKNLKLFIFSILFTIPIIPIDQVYGHGWGLDTTLIDIEGREISVSVEIPQFFEESEEKIITITAIDKKTKENVKNVTFLIGLYHENQMVFRNYFFTPDGNLMIHVIPNNKDETKITAEKDSLFGAFYATNDQPIELQGPIFKSGGLFNFEIELRTIDEPDNVVDNLGLYNADVSMVETKEYSIHNKDGNQINFKTKSYFDKISSFNYDADNKIITFQMPFDWNDKVISHIPVVHEEVHFPKDFEDLLTPSYTGKVNGIDLFKSNVIIDDYTVENERIVHFVILQDHLQYLKQQQRQLGNEIPDYMIFTLEVSDQVVFPMNAMTRDERFQVDLSWDPITIEPNKETKFVFTIRDVQTGEPLRQSTYDFVILQNNLEVYRTSGTAEIGGQSEDFTFSEGQSGPTVIRFENIRGTESGTEFGLVVVPEFGVIVIFILAAAFTSIIILNKKFIKI